MPRRPLRSIGTTRDVVPASSGACRGCIDLMCVVCFGDLSGCLYDDLDALYEPQPLRMLVEVDDDVYAALDAAAGRGMTIEEAARVALREWTEWQRKARR
jgi:hypothetical protein